MRQTRPINQLFLGACSYDHVSGKLACSVNGAPWTLSSASSTTVTQTASGLGALPADGSGAGWNGDAGQLVIVNLALQLEANAAIWAYWKQLFRDDYGITIA